MNIKEIKKSMEKHNISQMFIAERTGYSQAHISLVLSGKSKFKTGMQYAIERVIKEKINE